LNVIQKVNIIKLGEGKP